MINASNASRLHLRRPRFEYVWIVKVSFIAHKELHVRMFPVIACDPNDAVQQMLRTKVYKEFPTVEGHNIKVLSLKRRAKLTSKE